ncbi:hypothetical protein S40293_01516 [Stachybotrys chartarum IBT 40293]|nr:hypothetical protein S40293_01516 [Stachybotrys chartarum IBT 40293]
MPSCNPTVSQPGAAALKKGPHTRTRGSVVDPDTPFPSTELGNNPEHYGRHEEDRSSNNDGSSSPSTITTPSSPGSDGAPAEGDASSGDKRTISVSERFHNIRLETPPAFAMKEVLEATKAVERGSTTSSYLSPEPDGRRSASRASRSRSPRVKARRHEVADEEPPTDAFNNATFQGAFKTAKATMRSLQDALERTSLHRDPDSMMKSLHSEVEALASFTCPSTRTVGFVGDSGVGKSSLLNSLLDVKDLARASNSGAACTCVVTEYRYHDRDAFIVDAELFSESELQTQLRTMLKAYRYYHSHMSELEGEEKRDCEAKSKLAEDTFRTMFRDRLASDKGLLLDRSLKSTLATLMLWALDSRPTSFRGEKVCHTSQECSDLLQSLTSESSSKTEPTFWPYIRKIKVYLNAYILSKGLVLVDLPGLRDLNSARQNITERYVLECDEVFVVCNIGRATTDVGVKCVVDLSRQAQLSNVGIICTRSDDIVPEQAMRDWKGVRAKRIRKQLDSISDKETQIADLDAEMTEWNETGLDEMLEEEVMEYNRLNRCKWTIEREKRLLKFELQQYLITNRNEDVIAALHKTYKDTFPDGIKAFCVSNSMYSQHRDKSRDESIPYLNLSGIIGVRRHCTAMVSHSQLRIAKRYMQSDIPALLSSLELWVQAGAGSAGAEEKKAIRDTLDALEKRLQKEWTGRKSYLNSIQQTMCKDFSDIIYGRQSLSDWSRVANRAAASWSGWHHATYSAFCRNYGDYSTPAAGYHNWNEEAIAGMVKDLTGPFQELGIEYKDLSDEVMSFVQDELDRMIDFIETELAQSPETMQVLVQAISSRESLIQSAIEDILEQHRRKIRTLRTDTLSGIRTSLIGRKMESAYENCNMEGGRGSDARRKSIIHSALGSASVFEDLILDCKAAWDVLAGELQTEVRAVVKTHLGDVKQVLDLVRSDNVALESERDQEFRGSVEKELGVAWASIRSVHGSIESSP